MNIAEQKELVRGYRALVSKDWTAEKIRPILRAIMDAPELAKFLPRGIDQMVSDLCANLLAPDFQEKTNKSLEERFYGDEADDEFKRLCWEYLEEHGLIPTKEKYDVFVKFAFRHMVGAV